MDKPQLTKADIKKACDVLRMDDGVGANNYIEQLSWLLFLKIFENIEEELKELSENGKYIDIVDSEYKWSSWAKKDWKDKDELVFFINQKLFPYLRGLKGTPEKEKVSEIFREITNRIHSSSTILDTIDILDKIKMEHFQDTHLLSQVYEEILQEMGSEGGWSGEFYTPRPIIRLMIKIVNPKLGDVILDPFVGSAGFLVESFDYLQKNNPQMGIKEWESLQRKTFYGQEKKPLPYLIGMMNMILHQILVPNLTRTNTLMEDVHNMPESQKVDVILTNPPFGGRENKDVQNNYPIQVTATEGLALQYVMRRLKNGGKCGIVLPESDILFASGKYKEIREELLEKNQIEAMVALPKGIFKQVGADVTTYLIFFSKTGRTKNIWYYDFKGKYTKQNSIKDEDLNDIFLAFNEKLISENSWFVSYDELKENGFNLRAINKNRAIVESIDIETLKSDLLEKVADLNKSKELITKFNLEIDNAKIKEYRLSDLIHRNKTTVDILNDETYSRLTIKMHSKGISLRDTIKGTKIGTKKQFVISSGQFLISKIDARNGAFGIIPNDCNGSIITGNFWAYDIDENVILPSYFKYLLRTKEFEHFFEISSQGLTNRRYLQEELFLKQIVKLPNIEFQKTVLHKVDSLLNFLSLLKESEKSMDKLIEEVINKSFI